MKYRWIPFESLPATWTCSKNLWNREENSCSIPEEPMATNGIVLNEHELQQDYQDESENFTKHLKQFFLSRNSLFRKIPKLGGKVLDLYRLYREVTARGGFQKVNTRKGSWIEIFRRMPNYSQRITDASHRLKSHYLIFLHSYEQYYFLGVPLASIRVPLVTGKLLTHKMSQVSNGF